MVAISSSCQSMCRSRSTPSMHVTSCEHYTRGIRLVSSVYFGIRTKGMYTVLFMVQNIRSGELGRSTKRLRGHHNT